MPFWHRDPIEEHKRYNLAFSFTIVCHCLVHRVECDALNVPVLCSCRIKGAVYFDQTECKNKAIPIPFMLPPTDVFEEYIGKV